ncbi:hypothetical protein NFI96_011261 [Prochilodus magdalenae]|nr:hypothetical protein NFI96_011261 [Prochilodus magdalenae]
MYSVYTTCNGQKGIMVDVEVEGKPVSMQLDTGAAVTLVPERVYNVALSHLPLEESKMQLSTFSGENIPLLGQVTVKVKYEDQRANLPLVIVRGDRPALLGRNWLSQLKLNWKGIFSVASARGAVDLELEAVLQRHQNVFSDGPGTIREFKASINVKPNAKPIFKKARPVPYALKDAVGRELDRLEQLGIISKVDRSEWAAPIVVVPKADKSIRICGDYKVTVNQSVVDETYPLPNTEDLFATLAGGTLFTKLDLSHAYQQLELEKSSEKFLTINTHRGLYVYHRLSYGVSTAPSIFQGVMDQILQGLDQVTCFLDDILITAKTRKEHLRKLEEVLSRLERYGVRVKRAKCKFMQDKVEYLGHLIDKEGLHPTETKVAAILNAPRPSNVTELRSFLGLLNYYGRFLKDLSTLLQPLHQLLKKEVPWTWSPECDIAFQKTKQQLLHSSLVGHYDTQKPLRLACDASPYGLGAVISHTMEDGQEKPIAFASRTLSEAERKYSQIEKEALAIIFGVKKFHKYLYGRRFTLITDHKPLLTILGSGSAIPTLAALRMQRWALTLMAYNYDIQYRRSEDHANADALSRLPGAENDDTAKENSIFFFSVWDELPVSAIDIAQSTRKDAVLSKVLEFTLRGWPNYAKDENLKPFFIRRLELSSEQGCILWGSRVIIPPAHRNRLLSELHQGHPGICQMKSLARSYMWWPKLDSDIEERVQHCRSCQAVRKLPAVAPLHCWPWPSRVWQRIHVDFAEKNGQYFFVLVDSHSKWLEVVPMTTTTAAKTIEVLRNIFSSYGLPEEIVSDNGPQFTSQEYKNFLRSNGIKQTLVPVYHPASNGAAESMDPPRTLRIEIGRITRTLCVVGTELMVHLRRCAPIESNFFSVKCSPGVRCRILPASAAGGSLLTPQSLTQNSVLFISMDAASKLPNESKLSVKFYRSKKEALGNAVLHLTAVEISLDVDADRDGIVENNNPNKASWKWGPNGHGAIVLVNCDSESSFLKTVDTEKEKISKVSDLNDMSKMILRTKGPAQLPEGYKLSLHITQTDAESVRVFKNRNNEKQQASSTMKHMLLKLFMQDYPLVLNKERLVEEVPYLGGKAELEFYVEGLRFPDKDFEGLVTISLSLLEPSAQDFPETPIFTDKVVFRVAPWIMTPNTLKPVEVFVCSTTDNYEFLKGMKNLVKKSECKLKVCHQYMNRGDRWMQDEIEFGYIDSPHKRFPVVLDSPRDGALRDFPYEVLLGPDFGYVTRCAEKGEVGSLDSFGNLEVSPPVTVKGKNYPLGRIIIGVAFPTTAHGRNMTKVVQDFLWAQKVQEPIALYSDWLSVGHVDEFMSFVPAPDRKGFRLLLASPDAAYDVFTRLQKNGHGKAVLFEGKSETVSVDDILSDEEFRAENAYVQKCIDWNRDVLKKELGLDEEDIIDLPILFKVISDNENRALAYYPDMVNMIVLGKNLGIPKPFGPQVNGSCALEAQMRSLLEPLGLNCTFIDDFSCYHKLMGEVHCGSNVLREPFALKWWNLEL